MRAGGGCTVQHALTTEAATVVKQAVTLAKRRGHSQVTPLHVANTMLTSSTGLLRTACLQSHSHPLQCKALELCFNVALNRLPAAAPSHVLGTHLQNPSISNALVAAFKRAQAHQRRGSIENQQQPILAVKIEVEQLIISILDDPSVSRVMKEAGFSSSQVKSNVEQAVSSSNICSKNQTVTKDNSKGSNNSNLLVISHQSPLSSFDETGLVLGNINAPDTVRNEDVAFVLENMVSNKRKSIVVVGECLASVEGVVGAVMDKLNKGQDDVPQTIRSLKILHLSISSFENVHREEVEGRVEDLKRRVKSYISNDDGGVVLYLGDLKWTAEYRARKFKGHQLERNNNYYCAVEHVVGEIAKLVSGIGGNGRLWLMGFATFQSYMRCKTGYPSIETLWCLHPLTIPAGSLSLSLITDSGPETDCISKKAENRGPASPFELVESRSSSTTSSLPPWLQNCKDENRRHCNNNDEEYACQKWNNFGKNPMFSSLPASPSASGYSHERQNPNFHHFVHHEWPPTKLHSWRDHKFWNPPSESVNFVIELSSRSNSASSSEIMEIEYVPRFKELNSENLKTLCTELEKKVPSQKAIIPEIATTILQCRSGMSRRKLGPKCQNGASKQDTWFLFQGADAEAKEKVARELAWLVFGSYTSFSSITLSSFSSSTRADSPENYGNKRLRDEQSSGYIERFAEELAKNPHRVFFVEDVEEADYTAQMGFKRAMQRGRISSLVGDEVELSDAIVIFSCERCTSGIPTNFMLKSSQTRSCLSLDLNTLVEEDTAEDGDDDQSTDDIGLLGWVDGRVAFNVR